MSEQFQTFFQLLREHNYVELAKSIGYIGMFLIVFIETGLLVGFALPGDTLLISVGIAAAGGALSLPYALVALFLGSLLGNNVGYWLGRLAGPKFMSRISPEHHEKAESFMKRFGPISILAAPFVPIVRALVPFLSGTLSMNYPRFFFLTLLGTLLWTQGLTLLAYFLGTKIPNLDKFILPIVIVGVMAGVVPMLIKPFLDRRKS